MPRVLIVDDEFALRLLIRETLAADPNLTLIEASNGRQALDYATREPPDLILLDIMMPEMDGTEVYRALRASPTLKEIPVLFVSAKPLGEIDFAGLQLETSNYLPKPFEAADLEARVRDMLALS